MSIFLVSRLFDLLFGIKSFLTSNLQDVEARKKAGSRWSQEEDGLDAEQQNAESRYQKKDLNTTKDT